MKSPRGACAFVRTGILAVLGAGVAACGTSNTIPSGSSAAATPTVSIDIRDRVSDRGHPRPNDRVAELQQRLGESFVPL
jgi:hypothetical protein